VNANGHLPSYALIYAVFVFPLSIVRWITYVHNYRGRVSPLPPEATFATMSVYNLIGISNILLFFFTREGLLFFKDHPQTSVVVTFPTINVTTTIEFSIVGKVNDSPRAESF